MGWDAKMLGHAGRHIDKGAQAYGPRANACADQWHPLAGVFCAAPCRIVAVIGCENRQITRFQRSQKLPHTGIEPFQLPGIARHIAAVAKIAVKLDKVRKGQGTWFRVGCQRQ